MHKHTRTTHTQDIKHNAAVADITKELRGMTTDQLREKGENYKVFYNEFVNLNEFLNDTNFFVIQFDIHLFRRSSKHVIWKTVYTEAEKQCVCIMHSLFK
jgi:hypothetical protein